MTTREALYRLVDSIPASQLDDARKLLEPLSHPLAAPHDGREHRRRLGFLAGKVAVPDDFDRMGETEIAALFGVES